MKSGPSTTRKDLNIEHCCFLVPTAPSWAVFKRKYSEECSALVDEQEIRQTVARLRAELTAATAHITAERTESGASDF